jgi:hypothetical protein
MNVDLVNRKDYLQEDFYKNRKIIYGGFKGSMTWNYYLTGFDKSLHPMLESIKSYVKLFWEEMEEEFKSTRFCEKNFFLFDDNFSISFTVRSWGDFIAAVENKGRTYEDLYEIKNLA